MLNQAAVAVLRQGFGRIDREELRHGAEISIWMRWFVLVACLAEVAYRVDYAESGYISKTLYHLPPMASNGCAHYRIRTNPTVTCSGSWR